MIEKKRYGRIRLRRARLFLSLSRSVCSSSRPGTCRVPMQLSKRAEPIRGAIWQSVSGTLWTTLIGSRGAARRRSWRQIV